MAITIFIVCGAVLLALLVIGSRSSAKGKGSALSPVAKEFLTSRERQMLLSLEQALPNCRIHAQVSMGALLDAPPREGRRRTSADRNGFAQKMVDFVVQDRESGRILALVEVDDHTHRASRDKHGDAMTAAAGYGAIRLPASASPTLGNVRAAVAHLGELAPPTAIAAA